METVSPIFPVTTVVSPTTPEETSKLTPNSAVAVTFTRFEMAESFSIVTSRLAGA